MVLGYHLVFGAYGFWLPNDPRGSASAHVWSDALYRAGATTEVETTRSAEHELHNIERRYAARGALLRPTVHFSGLQARAIARGFARLCRAENVTVWACALMPNHVHLVTKPHAFGAEQLITRFKIAASRQLREEELHPFQELAAAHDALPKIWARGGRHVFLSSRREIVNRIGYVQRNPGEAGLPMQRWRFLTRFV